MVYVCVTDISVVGIQPVPGSCQPVFIGCECRAADMGEHSGQSAPAGITPYIRVSRFDCRSGRDAQHSQKRAARAARSGAAGHQDNLCFRRERFTDAGQGFLRVSQRRAVNVLARQAEGSRTAMGEDDNAADRNGLYRGQRCNRIQGVTSPGQPFDDCSLGEAGQDFLRVQHLMIDEEQGVRGGGRA